MDAARRLRDLLCKSGSGDASDSAGLFLRYRELLEKWNARVNLTGSTSWEALEPLFAEAIWAASLYPGGASRHLDIGSGAGFPALAMRILLPAMRLTLIEPRGKKAAFLETAAFELGLKEVRVCNCTLGEFLEDGDSADWDIVSWKALKIAGKELQALESAASGGTRFWVFHGETLPFDDSRFTRERREVCPARAASFLSIFRANVSRET